MMATPSTAAASATHPAETQPYWDAAARGTLLVKRCIDCQRLHHYPRALCPFCLSDRTEWQPVSGQGTLYTYSVMRRVQVPYAIAYVRLDEGVTLMTNIIDCDFDQLRIGQPVRVVFVATEGGLAIPMFTPA